LKKRRRKEWKRLHMIRVNSEPAALISAMVPCQMPNELINSYILFADTAILREKEEERGQVCLHVQRHSK
jgi:hypothetical protein